MPSRKWSIVALGLAGMILVVMSVLLALAIAVCCLSLPYFLFVVLSLQSASFLFTRLILSIFGLAAGITILWSLMPRKKHFEVTGVLVDLSKEPRLAKQIEKIATSLHEPLPENVYLVADANAFVVEHGGFLGMGSQRTIGLGLPLLQMLTVSQFRAVLAHEFAHYYAGDTRLGPMLYSTHRAMARVYENLGEKSELITQLTRWAVVAIPYMVLMGGMRLYWKIFMYLTHAISRRQEYRSDELACHIAGSQALAGGLEIIQRCQAALGAYWNSVVLPIAVGGYQPQLADGFMRFMSAPHIEKATSEYLAELNATEKPSAMDTHPPISRRIEIALRMNLPTPDAAGGESPKDPLMISLIDNLENLEGQLIKTCMPALANAKLKPMTWDDSGRAVYVPIWRNQIARYTAALSTKKLRDLPLLVKEPKAVSDLVPTPQGEFPNRERRDARAQEILSAAMALCLADNGWALVTDPGTMQLKSGDDVVEPGLLLSSLRAGKISPQGWIAFCEKHGMADWPLAVPPTPAALTLIS